MLWFIYILLDAMANWYIIEKKKERPFYLVFCIIRGIAAIVYGGLILDVQPETALAWFLFVTCSFPFLFNTTLNLSRGKKVVYFGADSGWIDSFMVKYNLQEAYFIITIMLFAFSIYLYTVNFTG